LLTILSSRRKENEVQFREESYRKTLADKDIEVSGREKRITILVQEKLYIEQQKEDIERENGRTLEDK
jgi:hypothetical protein